MMTEIGSKVLKFYETDGKLFKFEDTDSPIQIQPPYQEKAFILDFAYSLKDNLVWTFHFFLFKIKFEFFAYFFHF